MPDHPSEPQDRPRPARAGVVASCLVCGEPLPDGKPSGACSNRCRATLSRRDQAARQQVRDREIVAYLDMAERLEARAAELRAQARGLLST
jgi:predicted nucleic acid-binding Zn ribbon protein